MSTKYIATHDGHTWKRTTQYRKYTHAVIELVNIAIARAKVVSDSQYAFQKGWSPKDWADGVGARFDTRIASYPKSSDGTGYYVICGWAGRPDLAQKLASKGGIILEAQEVV